MKLIIQIVFIFFTWFTNQVYSNEPFFKYTQSIHGVNKGYSIRVAKIWDDFDNGLYLSDLNIYNAANDGTLVLDDIIEVSSIKLRRPNGTFADVEYRVVITSQGKVRMISKFNLDKLILNNGIDVQRIGNNVYNTVETSFQVIRKLHGAPKKGKPIDFIDNLAEDIRINGYRLDQNTPIEGVRMFDGQILIFDGHHRLAAMEKLGQTTVPIRIRDFSEIPDEGMRLMLKIGEESGFYLPSQYPAGFTIPDLGAVLNAEIDLQAKTFLIENF